jgi:3-dehydroquinate synthase
VLLTDKNVGRLHVGRLLQKFPSEIKDRIQLHQISIDPGESSKSIETMMEVLTSMMKLGVPRRGGVMITIGGGVVSDIGGLVANLYKRGIPVVHVPTTLLAQVDAAIGGKTGVDHHGAKNAIGTFYAPKRVLVDPIFLKTLEKRELHAGLGEVFKYALIGSKPMWQILAKSVRRLTRGVDASYESLIRDSIREKIAIVQRDEFERHEGVREILNFGHTFAHALEAATKFETFLHGEAVLLGMRAASWLSMKRALIDEQIWREIEIVLGRIPIAASTALQVGDVMPHFQNDKKRSAVGHRLVLLRAIGEATIVSKLPESALEEAVQFMLSLI